MSVALVLGAVAAAGLIGFEVRSSQVQSRFLTEWARGMAFALQPGAAVGAQFPKTGPYDERLGYAGIPSFVERLGKRGFVIEQQAAPSQEMAEFVAQGGYAIYREKMQAGLHIYDEHGVPVFRRLYPQWAYDDLSAVPRLVSDTLLYIEDRQLLDTEHPRRNPAVVWDRFLGAAAGRIPLLAEVAPVRGGASTLATQIEKFRHSPGGRTNNAQEKLTQMLSASMRAYMDGPDTTEARRRLLVTYLNSTPLGSYPGFGEVIGIADGLFAWYGTDFAAANRVLREPAETPAALTLKAQTYKQVLSLLLAQRRPAFYLNDIHALNELTNQYLRLLRNADFIGADLFAAARDVKLAFRTSPPVIEAGGFVDRKAVDAMRTDLQAALHLPGLYSLDRLDVSIRSTIDRNAQDIVTTRLKKLADPAYVKANGLVGDRLLGDADPARVAYSVVIYERDAHFDKVRVHADTLDKPFNLNSGAKLILGSTAKLRTTTTYLTIISALHERFAQASAADLRAAAPTAKDPLTTWAIDYLSNARDKSLQAMLDAAMQRHYSASPNEAFFTGGGRHTFANFNKTDDYLQPTVEDALRHSTNLSFIRLMRDITRYYLAIDSQQLASPDREAYLRRFADREGREFLTRFYEDYRNLTPDERLALLASRSDRKLTSLVLVYTAIAPSPSPQALRTFLATYLSTKTDDATAAKLLATYAPDKYALADRAYISGVHPLELWLVSYLQHHVDASRSEIMSASSDERQQAYDWLFHTNHRQRQDKRINALIQEDAYKHLLSDWRAQGYPFSQIIPSFATAIGSSGDRPDALARLMGIILNDGMDSSTSMIERVSFAAATPYQTDLTLGAPPAPTRVFAPEVARTLRRALIGVVDGGTAVRVRNAFATKDGVLPIGGKTGTGDNRFKTFSPTGDLIDSRSVDRTATFVFFIGDRLYGTITAYVFGAEADNYHFTSSLPVQLLKLMEPAIQSLLEPADEQLASTSIPPERVVATTP